jgi:hypothetical protein
VDRGKTWHDCGHFRDGMDLTDLVKAQRQYFLRFGAGAKDLAGTGLTIRTVCQANAATMPRLKDGGSTVSFAASGRGVVSAGPTVAQAKAHVVAGGFGTPEVTLELATPRREPAVAVYAAAEMQSGNPPRPDVRYSIDCSTDGGTTWQPIVKDWTVPRMGHEPTDFWAHSFCYGDAALREPTAGPVRVRFRNTGGRACLRTEAHLVYAAKGGDSTKVTFDWIDDAGPHRNADVVAPGGPVEWAIPTGRNVATRWVEYEPVAAGGAK